MGVPAGVIGITWTLVTRDAGMLYGWGVAIARFGLRRVGVHTRCVFEAPLPEGACLLLVNHASNLDPPLIAGALPRRLGVLLKQELLHIPFLGWGFRLAGFVPVSRSGRVEDARHSIEKAAETLRSGLSLLVFVEGTRSPDGRLLPFKKGPFFLAESCGLPVVPITIAGTHQLLPKGSIRLRAGEVRITVHPAIDPNCCNGRLALASEVRRSIASALPVA